MAVKESVILFSFIVFLSLVLELLISKPDPCLQLDWGEVSQMADLQTLKGKYTIDQGIVNCEDITVVGKKVFLFFDKRILSLHFIGLYNLLF